VVRVRAGAAPAPTPTTIPSHSASGGADEPRPPADGLSVTQRSKRLTDAYAEAEPMCKWPAVNGVVIKAIKSGKFADDEIRDALRRLAAEGRSVTVDTLRTELQGLPARQQSQSGRASGPKQANYSDEEYTSGW
jgi:hypothetical protein